MASLHNLGALILPEWRSGTPSCVLLSGARRAIPGPSASTSQAPMRLQAA
jgi:hypothetical protein